MTSYFVTGTDTDAGKTHVSRALLHAARNRGLRAAGYKPIESGCPAANSPGPDATLLAEAAGTIALTSYTLSPPLSPHLAAEQSGVAIQLSTIVEKAQQLQASHDFLIVEGAGGLLVPVSKDATIADLISALEIPTIIVAADRLGAINHSLLTIEAARGRQIPVAALVLTEVHDGAGQGLKNAESILNYGTVPVLSMPHTKSDSQLAIQGERLLAALFADTEAREERI